MKDMQMMNDILKDEIEKIQDILKNLSELHKRNERKKIIVARQIQVKAYQLSHQIVKLTEYFKKALKRRDNTQHLLSIFI
jgi:Na+/phosphate symporter